METQNCPKCGESNPVEAVMCWACYTPLSSKSAPLEVEVEETAREKLGRTVFDNLPYLLLTGLTASGWVGRRARWPVLGASLAGLGAFVLSQKWEERKQEKGNPEFSDEEAVPPIVRIAQTILLYALKENAEAVRLRENGKGVAVHYQIQGEWLQQMKVPLYVWRPLRQQLIEYARQGAAQFRAPWHLATGEQWFALGALRADLQASASGEILELQFENTPFIATENLPELALDTRCPSCHETNAPDALWCWNCYAVVETPRVTEWKSVGEQIVATVAILSLFGALGSSGWWPRRIRPFVLGAGALGLSVAFAWCPLQSHLKRLKEKREVDSEAPVERVVRLIFGRALQTQSSHIRLQERGNVSVSFTDDAGATRAEITLPAYVWLALRNHLLSLARTGFFIFGAEKRKLNAQLHCAAQGETLELELGELK